MKHRVMQKIREEKIRMRHPFVFMAHKLGLQSILALAIVASALILNIFLYFLKKTGVLKFLSLGWPGLKVILITLPYDYIVLFIITILLANFIIHKFDLSRGISMNSNVSVVFLLAVTLLLSSFFAVNGIEDIAKGWSKNKIPNDVAISGKILDYSNNQVVIQENDGSITKVNLDAETNQIFSQESGYVRGKFLRAIGGRYENSADEFHAQEVECCDED